jgi:hypothetical protein
MDINTVNGIIRAILPAALAYAVGKGWLSQSAAADVTAAVVAIASAIWSVISNRPAVKS